MRGSSLVELIGDDNSATLAVTVQIRMSPEECMYGNHIVYSKSSINWVRLLILMSRSRNFGRLIKTQIKAAL